LARHLDECRIGNRMLFGGNLVRQPAFVQLKKDNPQSLRVIGDMSGADRIMNDALFVGTYPGLSTSMLEYMVSEITAFATSKPRA
jgi:CDP-6-deoxy-D-xylo-4-hexulose-3-dehydrase